MIRTPETQHWMLLGTAPASEEVWGLRRIDFPCGYVIPPFAFAASGTALERPAPGGEVWAMGGFAVELSQGGKQIDAKAGLTCIAGYRPWACVFHDALLDELRTRTHTIEMWDRGVSIFYGLWREATHALGDLVPPAAFETLMGVPTGLETADGAAKGSAPADYAYGAADIVAFMSQFMTLSRGDLYIQGPLVAHRLPASASRFAFVAGDIRLETRVA